MEVYNEKAVNNGKIVYNKKAMGNSLTIRTAVGKGPGPSNAGFYF